MGEILDDAQARINTAKTQLKDSPATRPRLNDIVRERCERGSMAFGPPRRLARTSSHWHRRDRGTVMALPLTHFYCHMTSTSLG